jgi:[acyl-carrier-protein] S-malonyltransferase
MGAGASAAKVAACLSSSDWELRAEALMALGKMDKEGAKFESQVMAALQDSMPAVQAAALSALAGFAAVGVKGEVTASAAADFLSSKLPTLRAAACEALGAMAEEAEPHLDALVKLFKDKSETVQAAAVKAVASAGELGQMYASDACRLMYEGGATARAAACDALGMMGDRGQAFSEDIEALLEDPSALVREAAEKAVTSFAGIAGVEAIEAGELPPIGLSYIDPSIPRSSVAIMFPGQGSQYVNMLTDVKDLPKVKDMLASAKRILGYDILNLCLKGPESKLEATKFCQPAMYIGGLAALELLKKDEPAKVASCKAVAGLSLGEYTALTAAGVFDFETGLKLVKIRAEAMQEAAEASAQMMASIAGLEKDVVEKKCAEAKGSNDICQVANFLFPKGFACAGSKKAIESLVEKCLATDGCLAAKVLKTSGAFHTDFMKPARAKLLEALRGVQSSMKPAQCDVYMNVTGKILAKGATPADIVSMLGDQLCSCVLWEPLVQNLISEGIEEFYECGPQKQLKAMMKRINADVWKKTTNISV